MSEEERLFYETQARRTECEEDHLYFTRYFFKQRHGSSFIVNWHHHYIADELQLVMDGVTSNLVINVSPGSSKTELVVIDFISRSLALNPRARFLHLSYSDDLASLNSSTTRDIITSDTYQSLWPLRIADDAKAKKRWNVLVDGQPAGGVYATALGGQVTGFRAGHMTPGFQGAIIIDDPLKPDDAFTTSKVSIANRKLLTTVKSRKANPETPIVIIMQRIAEKDTVGFIEGGNLPGKWKFIKIPALIDAEYVSKLPEKIRNMVPQSEMDDKGRFSYWPYKEPLQDLLAMERGEGKDVDGARVSRHVFATQYQQSPIELGGNVIKGEKFVRYTVVPKIRYRVIYADTAQKTGERNDYSVFQCWGHGADGKIYLLDMIRGKWEAPELKRRAVAFWIKHRFNNADKDYKDKIELLGALRKMKVEDKSSGTGLIQSIRAEESIPIEGVERNKDKLTRVMDALPCIDSGLVCIPEQAEYTNDFLKECESFSADMSHAHDDQIDPMLDAIDDMLSTGNTLALWRRLA